MRFRVAVLLALAATSGARAQVDDAGASIARYRVVENWAQAPGRTLGSASMVAADDDGVWVLDRCGQNSCADRPDVAPILRYAFDGRSTSAFGAGRFVWPHGLRVDGGGNLWVTDGRAEAGHGLQVFKFSAEGELLLALGEAGRAGAGPTQFSGPTDVAVAANGDVFVADGHEADANNRIVKFAPDGRFLLAWGGSGDGPGQFRVPHALAFDSSGRLFVADRDNNRIQIFTQDGDFVAAWPQFGRPSGLHITPDDVLYVSDNQSNAANHPGWRRGIRVGSARDGKVLAFIADPEFDPAAERETGAHGLTVDGAGNIYGAEVWSQTVTKYVPQ